MVTHISKSGQVIKNISGYEVKRKDVPNAYAVIDRLERKKDGKKDS